MFQVRIHGRGGQGAVTGQNGSRSLLSLRAVLHAFLSFGSELGPGRRSSHSVVLPARKLLRLSVMQPDALIIQDPTLLGRLTCSPACRKTAMSCSTRAYIRNNRALRTLVAHFRPERLIRIRDRTRAQARWPPSAKRPLLGHLRRHPA